MNTITRLIAVAVAVSTLALVSGCTKQEKTISGALIGAGTGALIGSAAGHTGGGIAGAAIGGVAGGLIGHSMGDDK
jgi:uncharacterized protein YcfJ